MEPHSRNVKWRDDWPAIGPTLHLSCLSSYLKSVCQSFEARFDETLWNQCNEDSCLFYNADPNNVPELPYGPFSGIYEVYRDSHGSFEWKGRRPVYYQRNIELGEGNHPGKFSYCESEEAWVFSIHNVTKAGSDETKAGNDECNYWLLRSPKTEVYSLGDAPRTGWYMNHASVPADLFFQFTCGECQLHHHCTVSSGNRGVPVDVNGGDFKKAIRSYLDPSTGKSTYGSKISCWDVSK
eukprot:scaffold692024_cov102-Attheya_sp.AAC.1